MKLTQRTFQLGLLASLPLSFAFTPTIETLDLSPRFAEGQTITVTQNITADGALDELSVMAGGAPVFGDGVSADMEFTGEIVFAESILAVRDGDIAKMNLTVDTMDMSMSGAVDAMGEGESFDESMEPDHVGHTIELTIDEDGEITRKDVTEDVEPLDDATMAGMTYRNHFEMLLPEKPVEEGVPFELAPDWDTMLRDAMNGMEATEMSAEEREGMETVMNAFIDATTVDAVGKVTGVEDGIATIEYEMGMNMTIDDLVSLIQSVVPADEMGELPPGIESNVEATAEFTGVGQFNLALGQMVALKLSGDYEVSMAGSLDMDGNAMSADVLMSGAFELDSTITVE